MGVLSDLLASASTFNVVPPRVGNSKVIYRQLHDVMREGGDYSYPAGTTAGNETQVIDQHAHASSGTFTLTITLHEKAAFTTAAIAYNAIASTIETAIDTAAGLASVSGFVAGDISVSGGPLSASNLTLTFDGASVAGLNHGLTTINGASLVYTGGEAVLGAATTTTPGSGGADEVQQIAAFGNTVNGGNYTLTLNVNGGGAETTANIAHNANAAAVTSAINAVSTVTAGHIVVTGGPLTSGALIFTYSGADVDKTDYPQITINNVSLTATVTGTAGEVESTSEGLSTRSAWAALNCLGIIASEPPEQGEDPDEVDASLTRGSFPHKLDTETVRALINEACFQDENDAVKTMLLAAVGL